MTKPLVSIIVPIHNAELYLRECIESIRNQTYNNLQIILINDCSTDNSRKICEEYEKKEERVKLLNLTHRGGKQS